MDIICHEKIKQYENKDLQYVAFCERHIAENAEHRENVFNLLNYCETDFDREILRRRYVDREEIFDIAYDVGYSERCLYRKLKKALESLAKNTENLVPFEYWSVTES